MPNLCLTAILLMVGIGFDPNPTTLEQTELEDYIIRRYTVPNEPGDVGGLLPRNRFATAGEVRVQDLFPEDCWAFALTDGLFCYGRDIQPLVQESAPHDAVDLVQSHIHDAGILDALIFTEFAYSDSLHCATYYVRRLSVPSANVSDDDAYGDRVFGTGFTCSRPGWGVADYWKEATVGYSGETHFQVWDVFDRGETRYLLAAATGCAGECMYFALYRFAEDLTDPVTRVRLWSY